MLERVGHVQEGEDAESDLKILDVLPVLPLPAQWAAGWGLGKLLNYLLVS